MERRREREDAPPAPLPPCWSPGVEGRGGTAPTWTHLDQVRGGHRSRWSGHCRSGGVGVPGAGVVPGVSTVSWGGSPGPLPVPCSTWRRPQGARRGQVRVSRCPGCASGVPTLSSVAMEGLSGVSVVSVALMGGVPVLSKVSRCVSPSPGDPGCPWCPWKGVPRT